MYFYMPAKVYQEIGCVAKHAEELASLGNKALIVTGKKSAKTNGSYADVVEALKQCGKEFALFDEIEENPSTDTVLKARDFGISEGADFVIAIGGGSPMDAAKAIAVMMCYPEEGEDFLYSKWAEYKKLPIVCVPTTCGTGSETTGVSVLTVHAKGTKIAVPNSIFADLSLVDPKYIQTAPFSILANTSMDTFAHLAESYINANATPYSRMIAREGLAIWRKCKPFLLKEKEGDDRDYHHLMFSASVGGMTIAHTGTSLPHALSYRVTYATGLQHGKACGYFLSRYLDESDEHDRDVILELAGFETTEDLQIFYEQVCGTEKIAETTLCEAIKEVYENPGKLSRAPFEVDEAMLRRIAGLH